MGTRGAWGIAVDGELKFMAYNHCDSYPEGLGKDLANALHGLMTDSRRGKGWILTQARALRKVGDKPPTPEDIEACKPWTDLGVSRQSTSDWYCLTRKLQGGNLEDLLDLGLVFHSDDFPADSVMCEWAYVVDLDRNVLEVYKGFQKEPHTTGRFHALDLPENHNGYKPVRLVAEVPFWKLFRGDQWLKQIEKLADPDQESEAADA